MQQVLAKRTRRTASQSKRRMRPAPLRDQRQLQRREKLDPPHRAVAAAMQARAA
jgi:hypothetical protein